MEIDNTDPIDKIASDRGWRPLVRDESMTVEFGKKRYQVIRIDGESKQKITKKVRRELDAQTLGQSFAVQCETMRSTGARLVDEHQKNCATALLSAGINLIPSDILRDHQFVVSRGVYDAAKSAIDDSFKPTANWSNNT